LRDKNVLLTSVLKMMMIICNDLMCIYKLS